MVQFPPVSLQELDEFEELLVDMLDRLETAPTRHRHLLDCVERELERLREVAHGQQQALELVLTTLTRNAAPWRTARDPLSS
jgi:hypothetical protein